MGVPLEINSRNCCLEFERSERNPGRILFVEFELLQDHFLITEIKKVVGKLSPVTSAQINGNNNLNQPTRGRCYAQA